MLQLQVIGDPIEHSLSPALHTFIMESLDLDGEYTRRRVTNQIELRAVVDDLRSGRLTGLNITAPWKSEIRKHVDELTGAADQVGAVNTIKVGDGRLIGHNTDKDGFYRSVQELLEGKTMNTVAILGAGGAARAVLAGVQQLHPDFIRVVNRTVSNAEHLVELSEVENPIDIMELTEETVTDTLEWADLFINTLPPQGRSSFRRVAFPEVSQEQSRFYYDLVYALAYLEDVERAQAAGWQSRGGLDMLIYQGIAAMEFWLDRSVGHQLQIRDMREALRSAEKALS